MSCVRRPTLSPSSALSRSSPLTLLLAQLSVRAESSQALQSVSLGGNIVPIVKFTVEVVGYKFESPEKLVRIEQATVDRKKMPFSPVPYQLATASGQRLKVSS